MTAMMEKAVNVSQRNLFSLKPMWAASTGEFENLGSNEGDAKEKKNLEKRKLKSWKYQECGILFHCKFIKKAEEGLRK